MASHRDEDRRRARTGAMFAVSEQGYEMTETVHGTGRRAGTEPRLWRPYRGTARTIGLQETATYFGRMMVERGAISEEELQALRATAAFRGAFQGLDPEADARVCGQLAIQAMREHPEFTPRDHQIAEEAFAALADTRGETLSPVQELFLDAHGAEGIMAHSAESGLQRCIEDVTTGEGLVLPRSMAELGSVPIDPDKVDAALSDEKRRIDHQRFHRPEVSGTIEALGGTTGSLELLDELHDRFRTDLDLDVRPGTALVRGLDTIEYRRQHFRNLPSAEQLHAHQQGNFERHYGREPRPGELVPPTWELGPDAHWGRGTVDETLSAVDRVLADDDRQPGALNDLGGDGDDGPQAPPPPASPIEDGPTSGY